MEPIRARPVPFCFQSFLPEPDTSWRVLVAAVPDRRAAVYWRTASYKRCSFTSTANTASASSMEPTVALLRSTTFTLGIFLNPFVVLTLRAPHRDIAAVWSGNRTLYGDHVVLGVNAHNFEIADR